MENINFDKPLYVSVFSASLRNSFCILKSNAVGSSASNVQCIDLVQILVKQRDRCSRTDEAAFTISGWVGPKVEMKTTCGLN